jgi:two-component system, cell cycle sensor histidine kinase and response regulator CckA
MPEGGTIRLVLSLWRQEEGDAVPVAEMEPGRSWIRLEISDSGPGIEPDSLPHIFEPFFTTKSPAESTGLGLSQVYGIVRQHGGHIVAGNLPGGGAHFTLYLPPLPAPGPKTGNPSLPEPAARGAGNPRAHGSILLVEDDPVLRRVLLEMLAEGAYKVLAAGDGGEALQLFAEHRDEIGVVLTDLVMPDMSGLDLCHLLQQQAPGVKIIVMSGYPLNDEAQALVEQERLQWLQKPFTAEELIEKIH